MAESRSFISEYHSLTVQILLIAVKKYIGALNAHVLVHYVAGKGILMGKIIKKRGFTLVEIVIVAAIIGLLAALAVPGFIKARSHSHGVTCRQNRRIIFEALNIYCTDHGVELTPANFPNLCAARDTLAPGGSSEYVKDWKIFECPVVDGQDEHDYAYVWEDGVLVNIRCNNTGSSIRNRHNQY